jgi:predicted outer membrane repeat protein
MYNLQIVPYESLKAIFTSNRLHRDYSSNGGAVDISGNDNMVSVNEGAFINNTVLSGWGGALYSSGERAYISFVDVLFLNNSVTSGSGGAVYVSGGSKVISVKGGAFVNNMVEFGSGGALQTTLQQYSFSFVDVLFHNNSASLCGVLEVFRDSVNITHSTFTSNRATGRGPFSGNIYRGSGVACIRNSNISVVNSTFSNNSAVGNAGVMQVESSSVEIIDSTFEHNNATLDGGVTCTKLAPNNFTIHRSTFFDNRAGDDGGVMYLGRAGSRVDVNESEFSLNRAVDRGGAFVVLGSTLNTAKSTFTDNTAASGDDINACISEINTGNVFETSTSNRTGCISYSSLTLLPTEATTVATQTTEESATTRSMVRRTAPIIVPPQTIDPQTTAITPDYITTTDNPSGVSTNLTPQTDSKTSSVSTIAQTDSVSTLGATSQGGQETTVTANIVTESSTTRDFLQKKRSQPLQRNSKQALHLRGTAVQRLLLLNLQWLLTPVPLALKLNQALPQ